MNEHSQDLLGCGVLRGVSSRPGGRRRGGGEDRGIAVPALARRVAFRWYGTVGPHTLWARTGDVKNALPQRHCRWLIAALMSVRSHGDAADLASCNVGAAFRQPAAMVANQAKTIHDPSGANFGQLPQAVTESGVSWRDAQKAFSTRALRPCHRCSLRTFWTRDDACDRPS